MSELKLSLYLNKLTTLASKISNQKISNQNNFTIGRNENVVNIINSIKEHPSEWDSGTQIMSSYVGIDFVSALDRFDSGDNTFNLTVEVLDDIYSYLFIFFLEMDLSSYREMQFDLASVRTFTLENISNFSQGASNRMTHAINFLPIRMLKSLINAPQVKDINSYMRGIATSKEDVGMLIEEQNQLALQHKSNMQQAENDWRKYIDDKEERVGEIKTALESYKTGFNFVGLHKGFNNLSETLRKQKAWSFTSVLLLGLCVFFPLIFEFNQLSVLNKEYKSIYDLVYLVPAFSITFILIYYFRIALQNYSSIKAQLSQVELRKTLCQFIQDYGKYASEMKRDDSESLSKFENIIFSSIITNGDNIPATFDGLEQIIKLFGDLKKGS